MAESCQRQPIYYREIEEWRGFRKKLPKAERKPFDEMLRGAHRYNYAMMTSIPKQPIAFLPILMSIIYDHYVKLTELKKDFERKPLSSGNIPSPPRC